MITHRDYVENLTYDALADRIMPIDINTDEIIGAMESPGHWIDVAPSGEIFIGSPGLDADGGSVAGRAAAATIVSGGRTGPPRSVFPLHFSEHRQQHPRRPGSKSLYQKGGRKPSLPSPSCGSRFLRISLTSR